VAMKDDMNLFFVRSVSGALYRPLPITKQQNGRGSEDEKSELYPVSEMENKMIGCSTGANRVEILVKSDFEINRKSNELST
jgi:hypothetical protein